MSVAETWGTTEGERRRAFPCDAFATDGARALFRGIDVDAPPEVVFRWLCQLRAAPYSYDWIDNWGRRSPQQLTPGLEQLERGQRVMTIFELIDFEAPRHLTIATVAGERAARIFGELIVSYLVEPVAAGERDDARSRLLVKLRVARRRGLVTAIGDFVMPWADLFMMRRQLLNLRRLAEASSRDSSASLP